MQKMVGLLIWFLTALGGAAVLVYVLYSMSAAGFLPAILLAGLGALFVLLLGGFAYAMVTPAVEMG